LSPRSGCTSDESDGMATMGWLFLEHFVTPILVSTVILVAGMLLVYDLADAEGLQTAISTPVVLICGR